MTPRQIFTRKIDILEILAFFVYLGLLLLIICAQAFAEYKITALGPFIGDNERLIDAAPAGWLLIQDPKRPEFCAFRVNMHTRERVDLCKKGLQRAAAINNSGTVLGKRNKKTLATWNHKTGLKSLSKPKGKSFDSLTPLGINDAGAAVGYSTLRVKIEDEGDSYYHYVLSAIAARNGKTLKFMKYPGVEEEANEIANAINNAGDILMTRDYGLASLVHKNGEITRLGNFSGDYVYPLDGVLSLNNLGQVASSGGYEYIFSPGSGWRKVEGSEAICDRCDYGGFSAIGESGKAAFYNGYTLTLSDYPHPAIPVECLMPANRQVRNTNQTVLDLDTYSVANPRFIKGDKLLFNSEIAGDGKETRILLLEEDNSAQSGVYNYCFALSATRSEDPRYDCAYSSAQPQIANCRAEVTVANYASELPPVKVEIIARQYHAYPSEVTCPDQVVDTFEISGANASVSISFRMDPGFDYMLRSADPKFSTTEFIRSGSDVASPIGPCRKPFEGLVGIGEE